MMRHTCKICSGRANPFDTCDFNRSSKNGTTQLMSSEISVTYFKCADCGFLFTDYFDKWSVATFNNLIYNKTYAELDPDFMSIRPIQNAEIIVELFDKVKSTHSILDYGGGNGLLSQILINSGFDVESYDPMTDKHPPDRKFDIITSFEVLEHTKDPIDTVKDMRSYLSDKGLILFSTLLQPPEIEEVRLDWWYIGPRNGHISLYSSESLKLLFNKVGLVVDSLNTGFHLAYRGEVNGLS